MLAGRAEEVAFAAERLREGTGAFAICGEPGVGKSALLAAACEEAGVAARFGGGLEMLSSVSYLPLSRALGEDFEGADETSVARTAIEQLDGRTLVLDDLQWADPDTLAVLRLLVGRVPILAAARDGDPSAPHIVELLEEIGFDVLRLGPIDDEAARALVETTAPELGADAIAEILRNARGNPFLLLQLAGGEGASPTLELWLTARLARHGEAARESAGRAALLRREAPPDLLGPGARELLESGLALEGPDGISLRHALLADAVLALLDDGSERRLHAELAAALDDPGAAARHHLAAGDRARAHELALRAAEGSTRPAERASHLALAARAADGEDADLLRLRAASELIDAGEYETARELLEEVCAEDPETSAERALHAGRAAAAVGDQGSADETLAAGLALVEGSSSEIEVRLLLARADSLQQSEWGSPAALEWARRAQRLALANGVARGEAEYVFGVGLYVAGDTAEARAHCEQAVTLARDAGDHALEFKARFTLAAIASAGGDPERARRILGGCIEQAKALRMGSWELHARSLSACMGADQLGEYEHAIAELGTLIEEPLAFGPHLDEMRAAYIRALADTGRVAAGRRFLEATVEDAVTPTGRALLLSAGAELEWLAQRPRPALRLARESLAIETESPNRLAAELTLRWSLRETGEPPPPLVADTGFPTDGPSELEGAALVGLASGDCEEAARLFLAAGRGWRGLELRSELRCLWGGGEARLLAGDAAGARELLLAAEERVASHAMTPLLGRIRAGLRRAGVRRSASRGEEVGGLTAREHEVMGLVAEGHSSPDIAARLGVARSTVESQVRSAMTKLGATTRRQAANIVREAEAE